MEIVVKTDYQDIYRITDGVLSVVNKFHRIDSLPFHVVKNKPYNSKTQGLRVTECGAEYTDFWRGNQKNLGVAIVTPTLHNSYNNVKKSRSKILLFFILHIFIS